MFATLGLFYSNGFGFANLDTAFAAEAFFSIDGNGFAVLHLEYFHRTNINTFFAACAFFFINNRVKCHLSTASFLMLLNW